MRPHGLFKFLTVLPLCALLTGCLDKSWESSELLNYLSQNGQQKNMGQVRFVYDSLNTLSIGGLLRTNILPLKIYGTALLLADATSSDEKIDGKSLPIVMEKFGFIRAKKIANWRSDLAKEPELDGQKTFGFVRQNIDINILGKRYGLEVANITCSACHGGMTYDAAGLPTHQVWLGAPNSSINFDGFLGKIFQGLKIAANEPDRFLKKMREAYPDISDLEYKTISRRLMPTIKKEVAKIMAGGGGQVMPFPNGGPGITNGVGAFKRDAQLLKDKYAYNPHEAGFISIPDLSYRGFKSALTIDGVYGTLGKERFREVEKAEAYAPQHGAELAELASFFTFSAMGNSMKNAEQAIPRVQEIFTVLQYNSAPPYPGLVDEAKALRGSQIFAQSCAECHGTYAPGVQRPQLVSFPNRLVPTSSIGTDPMRWMRIDKSINVYNKKAVIGKHVDTAYSMGGYVAPLLSGLWYTAPYLHNGSVPTLWQLMNPELRPQKFQFGGQALDMKNVGIRGELNAAGEYVYPSDYTPWSSPSLFDVTESGCSNQGHEKEFQDFTEEQKRDLLEYLKLL